MWKKNLRVIYSDVFSHAETHITVRIGSEVFSRRNAHSLVSCAVRRVLIVEETPTSSRIRAAAGFQEAEVRLNEALTCPAKPCTCPRVINVTPLRRSVGHANQAVRRERTRANPTL